MEKETRRPYEVGRRHKRRKRGSTKESREQIRKGIGACIFVLGIPLAIAGVIITIVAYTKDDVNKLPNSFPVLGPLLIALSVLCFVIGSIMADVLNVITCWQSCFFSRSKHCCWKRCPKLLSALYPEEFVRIQQRNAGLSALQTVPTKPALKHSEKSKPDNGPLRHGVRFSYSGSYDVARVSVSSDQSDIAVLPDSDAGQTHSPSSSMLSLRHFRISPSEETTWVEMRHEAPVFEHASFDYTTEFCDLVNGVESYNKPKTKSVSNKQESFVSSVKRFDNQNGRITNDKSKSCDNICLQTVVFNVEENHNETQS